MWRWPNAVISIPRRSASTTPRRCRRNSRCSSSRTRERRSATTPVPGKRTPGGLSLFGTAAAPGCVTLHRRRELRYDRRTLFRSSAMSSGVLETVTGGGLVWDNHSCMPLRPDDYAFLPQLDQCRAVGVDMVTLNVGFGVMTIKDHVSMLATF